MRKPTKTAIRMCDPTGEELRRTLARDCYQILVDEFTTEAAIYWFANDWHTAIRMCDPTGEELRRTLARDCPYTDEFTTEAAIYWFANDWHSGQWSNLYSILSMSPYKPSILETKCPEDCNDCYQILVDEFGIPPLD